MNTRTLIAAAFVAFAASGTAMAQLNAYPESFSATQPVKSEVSRAAVKAQVLAAQADGTLHIEPLNYPRQVAANSTLTRAAVTAELRAELAAEQRSPQVDSQTIYGIAAYPFTSDFVSQRSRQAVRAETLAALAR
jgi:hypothetical protein